MTLCWQRKWREANSRPNTGKLSNRILHGPDWNRHKRVCVHFFPTAPLPHILIANDGQSAPLPSVYSFILLKRFSSRGIKVS